MGYYIQTPGHNLDKARIICEQHDAIVIKCPKAWSEIPEGYAVICVVENGPFDAASYCYSERELEEWKDTSSDKRRRTWLLMAEDKAKKLSGYSK